MMNVRATLATLAFAALAGPAIPAAAQSAPSFAQPLGNETLGGIVVRFTPGSYELGLRDDRGYLDTVWLSDRTIIFPIRYDLTPGLRVTIRGYNRGQAFQANQIDVEPASPEPDLESPAWYHVWTAPGAAGKLNPPAPPAVNAPAPR